MNIPDWKKKDGGIFLILDLRGLICAMQNFKVRSLLRKDLHSITRPTLQPHSLSPWVFSKCMQSTMKPLIRKTGSEVPPHSYREFKMADSPNLKWRCMWLPMHNVTVPWMEPHWGLINLSQPFWRVWCSPRSAGWDLTFFLESLIRLSPTEPSQGAELKRVSIKTFC